MALNTCKVWSNGNKIASSPKNYKNSPSGLGLRPQTHVCNTFELHQFAQHVSHFTLFWEVKALSFYQNGGYVLTHWPRLLIFQSTISLSNKKFFSRKFVVTSLHVVCALPLIKNLGYTYVPACSYCRKRQQFFASPEKKFCPIEPELFVGPGFSCQVRA